MLVVPEDSYLYLTGWMRSHLDERICDAEGRPVPWMNHPAVSFLQGRLSKDLSLFEYGSGSSTQFFEALVASVVSVEYDRAWYEKVQSMVGAGTKVLFVPKDENGAYANTVLLSGMDHDVIVIDGADRNNCMHMALDRTTDRGVIILDDSQRLPAYRPAFEAAKERGYRHITFEGMKSGGYGEMVHTTIFYRDKNCLGI